MEMLAKNNATSVIFGQLLNSCWWFLVKWKSYSTSNRAAEAAIHVIHRQLCLWKKTIVIFLWYWKINKRLNVDLCPLHCYRYTVSKIMNKQMPGGNTGTIHENTNYERLSQCSNLQHIGKIPCRLRLFFFHLRLCFQGKNGVVGFLNTNDNIQ